MYDLQRNEGSKMYLFKIPEGEEKDNQAEAAFKR